MSLEASNIQFTAFAPSLQSLDVDQFFIELVGAAPTQLNRQQTVAGYQTNASGTYSGKAYTVLFQMGRVDVLISPVDEADTGLPVLFASTAEAARSLLSTLSNLRKHFSGANRLSVVLTLTRPVASSKEAFAFIVPRAGISLQFSDGSDLGVQVNRRKDLISRPGQQMNRIMRYASTALRRVYLSPQQIKADEQEALYVNLQIDINIAPTAELIFDADEVPTVWEELLGEALRLRDAETISALES